MDDSKTNEKEKDLKGNIYNLDKNKINNMNKKYNEKGLSDSTSDNNFNSKKVLRNTLNRGSVFLIYSLFYYHIF